MAITTETIQAAVEQYLPRNANYAYDATSGEKDADALFARVLQVIRTSLLLDQDAIFYLVFLAAQRFQQKLSEIQLLLEEIQGTTLLRAVTATAPQKVTDFGHLEKARGHLSWLRGLLSAGGGFSLAHFTLFKTEIVAFLSEQVQPKLLGRNRVVLETDLRKKMEDLKTAWAEMLTERESLFAIVTGFQQVDLRSKVGLAIADLAASKLSDLQTAMTSATASEQAADAEEILLTSAAAKAALAIIDAAPSPFGTIVIDIGDDGRTERAYLETLGTARVEPYSFVVRGRHGRLQLTPLAVSLLGSLVDDLDGDSLTPTLSDASVDFIGIGVANGMFVTFARVGRSHRITAVTTNTLTLDPEVPLGLPDLRYLVTEQIPGSFFEDTSGSLDGADGTSALFWDPFSGGATGTVILEEGVAGAFVSDDKASGTDGSNIKTSGADGSIWPTRCDGTTGIIQEALFGSSPFGVTVALSYTFEDSAVPDYATFGVEPGAGQILELLSGTQSGVEFEITVVSEDLLTVAVAFTTSETNLSYEIRQADNRFTDDSATFMTDGVESGDTLSITAGPFLGTYTVDEVLSETLLSITTSFGATGETTGVAYTIYQSGAAIVLYDASGSFSSAGVQAGDTLYVSAPISGFSGTRTVLAVDSATTLFVTLAFPATEEGGVTWKVYQADSVFYATSGTFQSADVQAGDKLEILTLGVFTVVSVSAQTTLTVAESFGLDVGFADKTWRIYDVDEDGDEVSTLFEPSSSVGLFSLYPAHPSPVVDTKATFLAIDGVEDPYVVVRVQSDTALTVSVVGKVATGLRWTLYKDGGTKTLFDTVNFPFEGYSVGDGVVLQPGDSEERGIIVAIVSSSEATLSVEVTPDLDTIDYALLPRARSGMMLHAGGRQTTILSVVDGTTLEVQPPLPGSIGTNVEFLVTAQGAAKVVRRLVDDGASFTDALVGSPIDLAAEPPTVGTILRVVNATTLDVSVECRLGRRNIPYRIRNSAAGSTQVFHFAAVSDPSPLAEDYLTVWEEGVYTVASAAWDTGQEAVTLQERIPSSLSSLSYIGMRSGSRDHGEYLLLVHKNEALVLDADTSTLRLNVAEVLANFGVGAEDPFALSGTVGRTVDDGDGDSFTGVFRDDASTFVTAGARVGDRLTIGTTAVYVSEVTSEQQLLVSPTLPLNLVGQSWTLDRNSVSFAIHEAARLQDEVEALQSLIGAYSVPANSTVSSLLDILRQHGMSRAVDLLLSGDVASFVSLTSSGGVSFEGSAKASVQSLGQLLTGGSSTVTTSASGTTEYVDGENDTVTSLATASRELDGAVRSATVAQVTQDEIRNRAIYALIGEIESSVVSDTDPTLPWVKETGSKYEQLTVEGAAALASLDYILANPSEFAS